MMIIHANNHLKESLVVPVRVESLQIGSKDVVEPVENHVHARQHGVLVHPRVAWLTHK